MLDVWNVIAVYLPRGDIQIRLSLTETLAL
jgi:hypothetical protein